MGERAAESRPADLGGRSRPQREAGARAVDVDVGDRSFARVLFTDDDRHGVASVDLCGSVGLDCQGRRRHEHVVRAVGRFVRKRGGIAKLVRPMSGGGPAEVITVRGERAGEVDLVVVSQ